MLKPPISFYYEIRSSAPRKSDLDCQTESTHNTLSQRLKSRNEYTPKYRSRGASYRQITCQDSRSEQRRTHHHGAVIAEKETAHEDRSPLRAAEVSRTSSRVARPPAGQAPHRGRRACVPWRVSVSRRLQPKPKDKQTNYSVRGRRESFQHPDSTNLNGGTTSPQGHTSDTATVSAVKEEDYSSNQTY